MVKARLALRFHGDSLPVAGSCALWSGLAPSSALRAPSPPRGEQDPIDAGARPKARSLIGGAQRVLFQRGVVPGLVFPLLSPKKPRQSRLFLFPASR